MALKVKTGSGEERVRQAGGVAPSRVLHPEVRLEEKWVVAKNDTLWSLARKHLAAQKRVASNAEIAKLVEEIIAANPQIATPERKRGDIIFPGDEVIIPKVRAWAASGSTARPEATDRARATQAAEETERAAAATSQERIKELKTKLEGFSIAVARPDVRSSITPPQMLQLASFVLEVADTAPSLLESAPAKKMLELPGLGDVAAVSALARLIATGAALDGAIEQLRVRAERLGPQMFQALLEAYPHLKAAWAARTRGAEEPKQVEAAREATVAFEGTSRKSLEALVKKVWDSRSSINGPDDVYRLYSAALEPNALAAAEHPEYFQSLQGIADARPTGARSNIQAIPLDDAEGGNEVSLALGHLKNGRVTPEGQQALANTFYRFERSGAAQEIRERVYVNARAAVAPELMKFVVGMVDDPSKFPGVQLAKVAGPGAVGRRSENIVIYTTDEASAARVVAALKEYQAAHPDHFMTSTPMMAQRVLPGVARGAEPLASVNPEGKYSFGSLRSEKIFEALKASEGRGEAGFREAVDERLRAGGVDPDRPDRNIAGQVAAEEVAEEEDVAEAEGAEEDATEEGRES